MWLRRTIDISKLCLATKKILKCNNNNLRILSVYKFPFNCCTQCHFTTSSTTHGYDPNTDKFIRKQTNPRYDRNGNQRNDEHVSDPSDGRGNFVSFCKRFTRNLFLITGGIVWCGLVFIYFFVEEIEEVVAPVQDGDEEARVLAFYDIPFDNTDAERYKAKEKDKEEIDSLTYMKELALYKAIDTIKHQNIIVERLGKPVQLSGYRAAAKLDRMTDTFRNLTRSSSDTSNKQLCPGHVWVAECLIEGAKGLAALTLEFEKPSDKNEWILTKVTVDMLERSGNHLLDLDVSLPDGVQLFK